MAKIIKPVNNELTEGMKLESETSQFLAKCKNSIVKSDIASFSKPFFHDANTTMGVLHAFACNDSSRTYLEKDVVIPTTLMGDIAGIYFWLGLTIRTESKLGIDYLNHISIKLLKSVSMANNQELVSRADWDFRKECNPKFNHAQPHWHFHNKPVEKAPTTFVQFTAESEPSGFTAYLQKESAITTGDEHKETQVKVMPPKEIDFAKMHLAMASSWHSCYEHNISINKEQNVCSWLQNCLTYIRGQFYYLAKKQ